MPPSVNAVSTRQKKYGRWLLRAALAVCLLFTVLLCAVYIFLQRDPDALINKYLGEIQTRTGLRFDIASLDVAFLPLPALSISDLKITGNGINFTAAWVSARPGLLRILTGDFFPGSITILRPRLTLTTDQPLDKGLLDMARRLTAESGNGATLPGNLDLDLIQFNARAQGGENTELALTGMEGTLSLSRNGDISGNLDFSSLRLSRSQTPVWSLENIRINGGANMRNFFGDTQGLKISGVARYTGALRSAQFLCDFESSSSGWNGQIKVDAALDVGGFSIPLNLSGRATRLAGSSEIAIRGLDWQLGHDSGSMDLAATLPQSPAGPGLKGTFWANRLSLAEWMGWARNLCPGLQLALDNITRARVEFVLNEKGLDATRIEAACAGSTFTGTGGVPDWSRPVVMLNLATDKANLGIGLPESVAETPDAPWYPQPPLTPLPSEPLKPGETGIGYDIRLAAKKLEYGLVYFQNASLRIYPGRLDTNGFRDVLLEGKAKFYGGNVSGACILGADPSLPYHITTKAENINGQSLARDMQLLPFRQGKFAASATVTSRGKKLDVFLASLKGDLKATGENATLAATGSQQLFSTVSASARLRSARWNGKVLSFDGNWRAGVKSGEFRADCGINGPIGFGAGGLSFRNLPGNIEAVLNSGPLPPQTQLKLRGSFSAQPDDGKFEISRGVLELLGETINGNMKINAGKKPPAVQGSFNTDIANLDNVLKRLGIKTAKIPSAFNRLKLGAEISGSPSAIDLDKINAKLGGTTVSGSLKWQGEGQKPKFEAKLTLDRLNLSALSEGKSGQTGQQDFNILTTFNAGGNLHIKELTVWELRFLNAQIPFRLENGRLNASPLTANFYGAPLKCSASANFQKGLAFDASLAAHGFSLAKAAAARKIQTRLTGLASIDAKISAKTGGSQPLATALKGDWSVSVLQGSWQSVDKKGAPKGGETKFSSVRANGTVANGIVRNNTFSLTSDGLKVTGKGELNLSNQDLDCTFDVDMKGLPDFPVYIYGPLSSPKTSIGAGKMVLNAIGGMVSGFTGAIGGALKGAWGIFSK